MISMWEILFGFRLSLSDGNKVLQLENCESKCLAGFTKIFQKFQTYKVYFLTIPWKGSFMQCHTQQKVVKHPSCCRCSIGCVQR